MKTIRMPKESAQKWFAALRSGQYEQGFGGLLLGGDRYCCLGVLEHCLTGEVEAVGDGLPTLEWLKSHHITFLTRIPVFVSENTEYTPTGRAPTLPSERNSKGLVINAAEANDHGYSFEELADLLEQATEYTDEESTSQVTKESGKA